MGSAKISIKFTCVTCGKRIETGAKMRIGRRYTTISLPAIYEDPYPREPGEKANSITINKGASFDPDDDPTLMCSKACALKYFEKRLDRLVFDPSEL